MDNTVREISTYIQIKDTLGKYYSTEGEQRIQKIAILIKPLFSINMDTSKLMIKLNNGKQVKLLYYNEQAEFIGYHSLVEHPIWDTINDNDFGFIVTLDTDRSLVDHDVLNANIDMAYLIIKLSEDFTMKKGDTLEITLSPSTRITRTLVIEAPLPMKPVVTLN